MHMRTHPPSNALLNLLLLQKLKLFQGARARKTPRAS